MSGPKLSAAELERLRQEELERQRLEAIKKLQAAQTSYQDACTAMQAMRETAAQMLRQVDPAYRTGIEADHAALVASLKTIPVSFTKDPAVYHEAAAQMQAQIKAMPEKLQGLLGKAMSRSEAERAIRKADAVYSAFSHSFDTVGDIRGVLKLDFTCDYDLRVVTEQMQTLAMHYAALSSRQDMPELRKFAKEAAAELQARLQDPGLAGKLAPARERMQQLINDEQERIRQWKEQRQLYQSYLAIATMTNIVPKALSGFADHAALEKEVQRLQTLYRQQDEMDYIADQINAVMAEMGYSFVSSHVMRRADSETDCTLYQADERTGVAVYTSQDGAVMMRMTVLGDDPTISEDDRDFSLRRQIDFCAAHADLVEALAARGVYLKQKSYLAPDKRYTFKASTQTAAAQQDDVTRQQPVKDQQISRRRRRRANKKMRSM